MNSDQLNCLLAKITLVKEAIEALPSFGTTTIPEHPWECLTGVTVGSRRWDITTGFMWELTEIDIASMLVFKFDLGDFDSGDGLADIDINFYDGSNVLLFQILAGEDIQTELSANLDDVLAENTLVHRSVASGSYTYYARQKNNGATQANPLSGGDEIVSIKDNGGGIIVTPTAMGEAQCQWVFDARATH